MKWKEWVVVVVICLWVILVGLILLERGSLKSERDTLLERVEWQADSMRVYEIQWIECQDWNEHVRIANLDSLRTEIYFLQQDNQDFYDNWWECLLHSQELRKQVHLPLLYDSTVVIDGILYERAVGANTAHNDGVLIPFQNAAE